MFITDRAKPNSLKVHRLFRRQWCRKLFSSTQSSLLLRCSFWQINQSHHEIQHSLKRSTSGTICDILIVSLLLSAPLTLLKDGSRCHTVLWFHHIVLTMGCQTTFGGSPLPARFHPIPQCLSKSYYLPFLWFVIFNLQKQHTKKSAARGWNSRLWAYESYQVLPALHGRVLDSSAIFFLPNCHFDGLNCKTRCRRGRFPSSKFESHPG